MSGNVSMVLTNLSKLVIFTLTTFSNSNANVSKHPVDVRSSSNPTKSISNFVSTSFKVLVSVGIYLNLKLHLVISLAFHITYPPYNESSYSITVLIPFSRVHSTNPVYLTILHDYPLLPNCVHQSLRSYHNFVW